MEVIHSGRFKLFITFLRCYKAVMLRDCLAKSIRLRHWLINRLHDFRYVLKNKDTGDVFFVVVFALVLKEDVEKEEAAEKGKEMAGSTRKEEAFEPKADDLD